MGLDLQLARKMKRAQDVVWAVPREAADALFGTIEEYYYRGCIRERFRAGQPPPWWLKTCPMFVNGRDYYECMFIFRLQRFKIGYEVLGLSLDGCCIALAN